MPNRLRELNQIGPDARQPAYVPSKHGCGIVHLGLGAFHKAHQAVYTDDALAASGGDWRIVGVSLRSPDAANALNPQDGLFTLITRQESGDTARVIGSIAKVIAEPETPGQALKEMIAPNTCIVSLTVTEKAYGIDRTTREVDIGHLSIKHDLNNTIQPIGVVGLLVEAIRLRRSKNVAPFTVLCCDNLPSNGEYLRNGVVDFAKRVDPELADWIAQNVAFPSTMVDRITPASTDVTYADAGRFTGCKDRAAIETEPFTQWVIEDNFTSGRPDWEAGGALLVKDVAPYEHMKLRMLNGAHSMLAYTGFLAGCEYVRDVMDDAALRILVERHLDAAAATLQPLDGIKFEDYAAELLERFANPAIAHMTYQIAMDGTEKLPQRLLEPAVETLEQGGDLRPFAFAVGAWMRYCTGRDEAGNTYTLRDPRQDQIAKIVAAAGDAEALVAGLHALPGLFPEKLLANEHWTPLVTYIVSRFISEGVRATIDEIAQ